MKYELLGELHIVPDMKSKLNGCFREAQLLDFSKELLKFHS